MVRHTQEYLVRLMAACKEPCTYSHCVFATATTPDLAQLLKFKYRDDDGDLEEMEVIPMVSKRWKIFGVGGLGMKDFKVDSCKCDNDIDSCCSLLQMFLQNGSKKFREPKWSSVIQAMRDTDFNALATELEKALTHMKK